MGELQRMECQFEIKSSAEKFFDVYKNKPYLMAKLSNQTVNDVKLLQGNWNSQGSFRLWHIAVAGSLVKWTMEFEKQNENIPDPVKYGEFLTAWAKLLDA
ncbi:MLP-like protein 28 [Hibiscus syriacus]|uniref:MLP-like protein 28 n=1 Tax=Hibiscus syriacus TaxID=106335 RepID=UPI001920A4AC|nr:MLP-like protein 28 [Hibiscus syriacus]